MITHSRETCQPTNIMRWENGVFSMVDWNSGEKVRQGPQINPLLLVHKSYKHHYHWLALIVAVPLVFLMTHEVTWPGCEETSCQVRTLGVGLRILGAWFSVWQQFNHNYADVCPHSLWNFVNIIEYCPSLLWNGKYKSFLWTKCCLMPCSTPIVDSSHVFYSTTNLVALPTIQGFSPGAIGLTG